MICVCVYVCVYIYIYIHIYTHICILYTYIYIYMYTHIHIHTHTHVYVLFMITAQDLAAARPLPPLGAPARSLAVELSTTHERSRPRRLRILISRLKQHYPRIPQKRLQTQEETLRQQGNTMCVVGFDAYYRLVFLQSLLGFGVSSGESKGTMSLLYFIVLLLQC